MTDLPNKPEGQKANEQEVQIPVERQGTIRRLEGEGQQLLAALGAERAKYIVTEAELMRRLNQSQTTLETTVKEIAKDLKLDTQNTSWSLDMAKLTLKPKRR